MTFLENLQAHRGGLIHLKTELYWYGKGWDGHPGRICLILDAIGGHDATAFTADAAFTADDDDRAGAVAAAALLMIEDRPQWIWMAEADVEVL